MNWRMDIGASGLPRWSGTDSVQDPHKRRASDEALGWGAACALVGFVIGDLTGGFGGALLGVFFGALAGLVLGRDDGAAEFDTRRWTLTADLGGLHFSAPASRYLKAARWSVTLDQIARIETGRTVDWEAGRDYGRYLGNRIVLAPHAEHQVFLFLADGSRRVFHTVNADREDAGTLALSVRTWHEAEKVMAAQRAQTSSQSVREGFDI